MKEILEENFRWIVYSRFWRKYLFRLSLKCFHKLSLTILHRPREENLNFQSWCQKANSNFFKDAQLLWGRHYIIDSLWLLCSPTDSKHSQRFLFNCYTDDGDGKEFACLLPQISGALISNNSQTNSTDKRKTPIKNEKLSSAYFIHFSSRFLLIHIRYAFVKVFFCFKHHHQKKRETKRQGLVVKETRHNLWWRKTNNKLCMRQANF